MAPFIFFSSSPSAQVAITAEAVATSVSTAASRVVGKDEQRAVLGAARGVEGALADLLRGQRDEAPREQVRRLPLDLFLS